MIRACSTSRWEDLPDRARAARCASDIKPELVVARVPPPVSALLAERRVLRRDDGSTFLARRDHRARGALARRRGHLRLPARLAVSADGGRWGACHGLDIPLVFGTLDAAGFAHRQAARMRSPCPARSAMHSSPLRGPAIRITPGLPEWRPYRLEERATMMFDLRSRPVNDPRREERRLFEKVPFIQQGT